MLLVRTERHLAQLLLRGLEASTYDVKLMCCSPVICCPVMQALVRLPFVHTKLADNLVEHRPERYGFPDLDALLTWLWPFTAAAERRCRTVCMWLHNKLAVLQLLHALPGMLD